MTLFSPLVFRSAVSRRFAACTLVLASAMALDARLTAAQDSVAAPVLKAATTGVYTDAQAKRGDEAYKSYCVSCHSAKAYTGDAFKTAWLSQTAFDIFRLISTTMPDDNPGVLARQEYADIVAYIISLNGYPVGADELPSDDEGLKRVKIDSLPSGTFGAHDAWSARLLRRQLTRARTVGSPKPAQGARRSNR